MTENLKLPGPAQRKGFPGPRTRSPGFRVGLVCAVFAAAVIIAAVVVVFLLPSAASAPRGTATLKGTGLVPGVGGDATLAQTTQGWRIELDVTGLPRRDSQRDYYEAWLKNAAGILVPVGTFNQGPSVTLWAGVSPLDFPTLTVTQQQVGRSEASSGKPVLTGPVDVHR